MSSNGNSVSSSKPADTRDAKEKEKERLKELEKEAERERERIREKEIRAFREFSTTLPIKQTRRSRGASFVQEQQEAAAKAQSAALQAQWGSLNGGVGGGGAGNMSLGMNNSSMLGIGGGHGGVAGSYLSSLGGDMGGGAGNKALRSGNGVGLHPVSPLHGVGGAGAAGHLNSMNINNSGAGYGGTDMAYSSNVNSVLQQQMQIGEQHLASNSHAASIAMNAHGRKTPRAVALTMPPLQQQDSGGGQAGSGLGAAQQRLRAGGRPHVASQPSGGSGGGGMWDASAAALGGGMNGMTGGGGGGAPWQTPQQQQQPMGGFGGGHMMNSGPSPTLSALPNINMNPTFGNMNMGMNGHQQQQLQGNSRPMQPTQMQYGGYEQQDFAHQQHQHQQMQQQQHQHLLHQQQQQQMGNVGANSNYSGMQQQLNTRRPVLSRENGPSLAGPVGGMGIGLTPLSGGVLGAYSNSNGLSSNGAGGYAHMGNAPPLQHLQQHQQQYSSPHHQQQQQQQQHHPPQLQQQAPQHQHQPHGHRSNAANSNLRNGNSVRTSHCF